MFPAVSNVIICISVEPGPTDVSVVHLVGLAYCGQDCFPKRRNSLYIRTKKRLLTVTGAQGSGIPLNRIQAPKHLEVMLGWGAEVFIRNCSIRRLP
eukprot:9488669-Pyramimonas_sp.AAC.2